MKDKKNKDRLMLEMECEIIPDSARFSAEHADMVYYFCSTPYLGHLVPEDGD